jgi:hypothetical protein
MDTGYGMDHLEESEKAGWERWSSSAYVSTGSYPEAAVHLPLRKVQMLQMWKSNSGAQACLRAEKGLKQRRHTTTVPGRLNSHVSSCSPDTPSCIRVMVEGFKHGFDLGIPVAPSPPNHASILHLRDVYTFTVHNEFATSAPFHARSWRLSWASLQTSPLSFGTKASKPGKYRAVHNFSFPHNHSTDAVSINSRINSESFPCTWETFTTVALLMARLHPGSLRCAWTIDPVPCRRIP